MIRNDLRELSDDELANLVTPFFEKVHNFAKTNLFPEFIAYYIATAYNDNVLWEQSLDQLLYTISEEFNQMKTNDINFNKFNKILIEKYHLKITNKNPIKIKSTIGTL